MALGRWTPLDANVRSLRSSGTAWLCVASTPTVPNQPSDSTQDASGPCGDDTAVTTLP